MKLIIAIIQPTKLEAVKEALSHVEVFRLTVMDVQGFGRQKGDTEVYRGHEFTVNLLRKIELQIAVNEDFVEPTINAIIRAGRTGPADQMMLASGQPSAEYVLFLVFDQAGTLRSRVRVAAGQPGESDVRLVAFAGM